MTSRPAASTIGAAVLLLLAGLGAASRAQVPGRTAQIGPAVTAVAWVVVAVAALATITAVVSLLRGRRWRRRRRPDERQHLLEIPQSRWAKLAALVVALAVIMTPLLLGLEILRHQSTGRSPSTATSPISSVTPTSPTQHHTDGGSGLGAVDGLVLGGVALLAVAGAVYLRGRGSAAPSTANHAGEQPLVQRRLEASVRAGSSAMAGVDDARRAIIACYTAMERSLAAAGLLRGAAQTPAELLAAASVTGVVRSAAAGELTALFEEARFSDHPMTSGHRGRAVGALRQLQDDVVARW